VCDPTTCRQVINGECEDHIGGIVAESLIPFLGENTKMHSGVTDGEELASVGFKSIEFRKTKKVCMAKVVSRLCICHRMNNAIKK